ncbi:peptide ABC transporter permease [Sporosarcina sp. P12(2017)]|uniref:ABC transporter permease n=1 Tax=unclassified Sporosarcina TaxID=2647733 RepID=UPI000C1637D5|nr:MULTISPECIES: ABC transporter permease [unclassified Sporosarcina]PIC58031.1 peptide ABC transporter permease [Sporosarcina sp. P10]PIC59434.1 peptide ABC transporter permease [Sporosarcina sp. P12(2017)]
MKSRKALLFWCSLLGLIVFLTVFSNMLAPFSPNEMNMDEVYSAPSSDHWLGTDHLGRDVLSRLLEGGKVTLAVASGSVILSLIIGIVYGGISGYFGGLTDTVMMRLLEALITIPAIIIILSFQAIIQGGMWGMTLLIGLTGWLVTARIVRSEFIRLKEEEFVKMANMFGTPVWKILWGHLLRNSIPAIFVVTLFNFAGAIFMEVSLSFLGIGIPPAIPSWGNMLYYAQNDILIGAWWIALFPGIMIFLTILSINFIGETWKNPKRRRVND